MSSPLGKFRLLTDHVRDVLGTDRQGRVLVLVPHRRSAVGLAADLRSRQVRAAAMHPRLTHAVRRRTLDAFLHRRLRVVVAAARAGEDLSLIAAASTHLVLFDVHRATATEIYHLELGRDRDGAPRVLTFF